MNKQQILEQLFSTIETAYHYRQSHHLFGMNQSIDAAYDLVRKYNSTDDSAVPINDN